MRNQRKANGKKQPKSSKQDPNLLIRPAFPGQFVCSIKLPGTTSQLSTTVTTGVIATAITCDPITNITGWGTRFQSTFKEYRVVKALLKMKTFSSVLPGQINSWIDETLTSAPTANQALQYQGVTTYPAGNNERTHIVKWSPHSLSELSYLPIGTASNNATFKIYTDNAVFGASAVATPYMTAQVIYSIQFRGIL